MGAWIEIRLLYLGSQRCTSLPLWERGLKLIRDILIRHTNSVAPLVGAWIEIKESGQGSGEGGVAPLVGAWIEI